MDFIIKRSGKDEKSVAWSFFSFSSCFIDLIPNFVSNIGFRISRWRETELKGNPVQIRNYPRSCKFLLGGTFSQPLAVRAGKACRPEQVRRPAVAFIRFATCGCTGENQNSDFPLHPAFRSNTRLPTALRKVWIRFEFLLCRIPQGYGWFFICQT